MGKEEILNLLEKNKGKKFTSKDIIKATKLSQSSVATCLLKMRINGEVRFRINLIEKVRKEYYEYWID